MDGKKRAESKIPVSSPSPMRRTGSLRLGKCPPIQEHQIEKLHPLKLNRRHSLVSKIHLNYSFLDLLKFYNKILFFWLPRRLSDYGIVLRCRLSQVQVP